VFKDNIPRTPKPRSVKLVEAIEKDRPSPDECEANKKKWGLEA